MSATGNGPDAGTTLIEALVVVAITSLVTLIGFPRLQQSLRILSQRQTAAVVAARLREARADAMSADRARAFVVGADGRGFAATGRGFARTPPGVELSAPTGRAIVFFGDGSSNGGAVWVSAGRRSTPIIVAPATGAVGGA